MILSLRQRHRRVFSVIGVLLPFAFAVGIAARKPVPNVASLPAGLIASPEKFSVTEWKRDDLFSKNPIQIRLLREATGAGHLTVSFSAAKDFVKPDLIVYWIAASQMITNTLPDNALLLGAFSSPALPLPEGASKAFGVLVLYSLADNEVVDVSKPITTKRN